MSIDWGIIALAIPLLFTGLWTTLRICVLAIALGSLLGFINDGLARLKADDRIYKLQEKWFGFRMQLADKVPSFDA